MAEGCGAHGKMVSVNIVKPHHAQAHAAQPSSGALLQLLQGNATLKPGDVFLLCQTTDDATNIMRAMGHRKYDGRQIQMTSFEEGKFMSRCGSSWPFGFESVDTSLTQVFTPKI
eukprot:Skav226623  [mRNA]  locus=scaffold2041:351676:352780:- [translate_table: standard]